MIPKTINFQQRGGADKPRGVFVRSFNWISVPIIMLNELLYG